MSKKYILCTLVMLVIYSCSEQNKIQDNFPKDSSISDIHGQPKDSLTFYFPKTIRQDSQFIKVEMEDFMNDWYSCNLHCFKEPILSNYYLGHDIYRFLWLRSFDRPVIFSLNKDENKVWLTIKILNKHPQVNEVKYFVPDLEHKYIIDSVVKADRQAILVYDETKYLTIKEWQEFEELLNNSLFWKSKPYQFSIQIDGSDWTIESHLKNQYWFVNKNSPNDSFKAAGVYLINKSGLKESIY